MLEHHFWENFRKWIPHLEADEVPEEIHHFFICGTNLMADVSSDEYPTVTFIKRDTKL